MKYDWRQLVIQIVIAVAGVLSGALGTSYVMQPANPDQDQPVQHQNK